jgi:hypothetical protein
MARPRKQNVKRDRNGISREYLVRQRTDYEKTIARRAIDIIRDGLMAENAVDSMSGFTLGRLRLRGRSDPSDPSGINEKQYWAGMEWTNLVYRHAALMGYKLNIQSPSVQMVSNGLSCLKEPEKDEILEVRRQWSDCYNSLMDKVKIYNAPRLSNVVYGVCIENWPVQQLTPPDYGLLRIGLNALAWALK